MLSSAAAGCVRLAAQTKPNLQIAVSVPPGSPTLPVKTGLPIIGPSRGDGDDRFGSDVASLVYNQLSREHYTVYCSCFGP